MSRSLVIIPTYNEIENIASIIQHVLSLGDDFEILIVDDNSPDGTGQYVSVESSKNSRIHLLSRAKKLGLGTAYIAGFKYGLENGFEYIIEMDADFSHNPNDLTRLLTACKKGADVAIGSRYVKNGKISNWPTDRLLLSFGASLYVRCVTWMPIKDPTAGFICYQRHVLSSMDLEKIKFVGYSFQIEMKYYAYNLGFTLREIPITFTDRVKGQSKMSSSIISEAIKGVLVMRWRKLKGYYK